MNNNIYQPLCTDTKQIRLLTLQPSAETATRITGTVENTDLEHQPEYEAISWFWGEPPFTGSMILNGVHFTIPQNLVEALKHFRLPERPRTLWVDAVCIDQTKIPEREAQIKLMGDIYSTATCTLVWLGLMETDTDQFAFESLNKLSHGISLRQIILEKAGGWTSRERCPDDDLDSRLEELDPEELDPEGGQYKDTDLLEQLSSFFELDWWKRLWVLQEVALASEVQLLWGNEHMDFTQLTSAYDRLLTEFRDKQTILQNILGQRGIQEFIDLLEGRVNTARQLKRIYDLIRGTEGTMSPRDMCFLMIEVLAKGRIRTASKLHDKVYGLLGLVPPDLVQKFQPSYSQTPKQVFSTTAYRILELSKSFMLFNCIREGSLFPPSWCPDWGYQYHQIQDFHLRAQQEQLFQACANAPWHLRINVPPLDMHVLEVKGFRLDVVHREWQLQYDLLDAANLYLFLQDCVRHINDDLFKVEGLKFHIHRYSKQIQETRYITGIGILEAVSRIALNDCEPSLEDGLIRRLSGDNSRRFEEWFSTVDEEYNLTGYLRETIDYSEAISFEGIDNPSMCEFARSVNRGKSFFTTKLGYAGLVDYELHNPTNEVWILAGGSQPVVLHPGPRQGAYCVSSEAYVHGVMDGEAARGEVPVLPEDGNSEPVISDLKNGRNSWPQPEFRTIQLW
jgi:hypothetical protein